MFVSYAQNFEDVMLWRALGHIEKGFYIDIGAQDPMVDSVSQGFYEHGWRGVHVEPTPTYAEALRIARPDETIVQAAVGNEGALIPFYEIPRTGISTGDANIAQRHARMGYAHQRIDVPCIRLSTLLDRYGDREIHWMKIDVEGMELSVLESWDPSPVRPWVVVLESTLPTSTASSHEEWESIIFGLDYRFAYFDGLNRFYVSNDHPELEPAFDRPPNVFDAFALSGRACNTFSEKIKDGLNRLESDNRTLREAFERERSQAELAVESSRTLARNLEEAVAHERRSSNQLQAALDGQKVAAVAQAEDRQSRREAETALARLRDELALLDEAAKRREDFWQKNIATTVAGHQAEVIRLRRETTGLEARVNQLEFLRRRILAAHEAQVLQYLQRIERAEALAAQASEYAKASSSPPRRSHRFDQVLSNPVISVFFNFDRSTLQAAEFAMNAPLFSRTNFQPAFTPRADGEYDLEEFLSLHDRAFVRAAYRAILHREPDPQGEAFYLSQVRAGEPKSRSLAEMLRSDEAKQYRTVIAGLERHERLTRWCEMRVIGHLVAAVLFLARVNEHMRELRAFENHVIRIAEESQVMHEANMNKLRAIS